MNILLVDDNRELLKSWERCIQVHADEHKLFLADNSWKAILYLEQHEIHLIITDLKMPYMSGHQLIRMLAHDYPQIPVVVVSAYDLSYDDRFLPNIYKFLKKPICNDVLVSTISSVSKQGVFIGFHTDTLDIKANHDLMNKMLIIKAMELFNNDINTVARSLNISVKTLQKYIKDYNVAH